MRRATLFLLVLAACGDKDNTNPPTDDSAQPADADGDGYTADVDCADSVASIHPGAVEICDGADQDCDGAVDNDASDASLWYADGDGDGFGLAGTEVSACAPPDGYVAQGGDCDDSRAATRPGAPDDCNGVDDNCDGLIDENDLVVWYRDQDGDGWGAGRTLEACVQPNGYAAQAGDCDDAQALSNPGLPEQCDDGIDNNCDGSDGGCSLSGELGAADANAVFNGVGSDNYLGISMAFVGDVTGDGVGDLMLGSPYISYASGANDYAGRVYVVSATTAGSNAVDAVDQAVILGLAGNELGTGVGGGFDYTTDGLPDLVVSAPGASYASTEVGAVYIFTSPVNGSLIPSRASAALYGDSSSGYFASNMATVPDVTGDVWADIAVADSNYYDSSTGNTTGAVYVFIGPMRGSTDVSHARAVLYGAGSYTSFGDSISYLGDVNGDGTGDLAVGAPYVTLGGQSQRGGVGIYEGPLSGSYAVTDAEAYAVGRNAYDYAGSALTELGDVDGDGYDDLAYSVPGYDSNLGEEGAVLILHGPFSGTLGAADVDATIVGVESSGGFGYALNAGDINNDGEQDVLVGCPYCSGSLSYAGVEYVVYGPFSGTRSADDGAQIAGDEAYGYTGYAATVADFNGDGLQDFAVGEPVHSVGNYSYAGRVLSFLTHGL